MDVLSSRVGKRSKGHFMNDTIKVLTKEFMILHRCFTTYYLQASGKMESTNKEFKIVLTDMANPNCTDWNTISHSLCGKKREDKILSHELHLAFKKKMEQL